MKLFYGYMIAINIIAFITYGIDKLKAKRKAWRIPEKTLWLLGLAGGFIGSLLAMQVFNHKTRHISFYIINFLSIILWAVIFVFIASRG